MRDLTTNDRWWLLALAWTFAIFIHAIVEAWL